MQIARGGLSTYGRAIPLLRSTCRLRISLLSTSAQQPPTYTSSIYAEPLSRYKKGGYHPVVLGEFLKAGRYKVLHKLGWGGYSTVWAAKDQRLYMYKPKHFAIIAANPKGLPL